NVTGLTTGGSTSSGAPAESTSSGGASDGGTAASTSTGTTDALGSSTGTTTTGTTTTGDTSTGPDSTSTTFPAPIQECVDNVDPGDECTYCMCVNCLELWEACQEKEWCRYLQECAQYNGCYGIDCLSHCKTAIDFAGGVTGEDFLKWLAASDCMKP